MDKIKIASLISATLMIMLGITGLVLYKGNQSNDTNLTLPQVVKLKNDVAFHQLQPPSYLQSSWKEHNASASYGVYSGFLFLKIQLETNQTSVLKNSTFTGLNSYVILTTDNLQDSQYQKISILIVLEQGRGASVSSSNQSSASAALTEGPYSLNMYKKTGIQSNGNTWEAGLAVQRIVLNSLTSGDITPFIGLVGSVYSGEELPLASLLVIPEITVAALLAAVIAVIVVAVTVYVILFLLAHQGPNNQITLYESLGLSHINIPWWEIWAGSGYGEYAELGAYDNAGYYAGYYHSSAYYYPALTTGGLNTYTPHTSPWNPNDGPPWG